MVRLLPAYCAVFVAIFVALLHADIPGAKDPNAYTEHDYRREKLEFYRRIFVESFKKVGSHNRAWDAGAEKFLDGMARHFAYRDAHLRYDLPDRPSAENLLAQGGLLLAGGCDDPMVIFCQASLLDDADNAAQALPMLRKAVEGLGARRYPPPAIMLATDRLVKHIPSRTFPEERKVIAQILWDTTLECATAVDYPGRQKRILIEQIWPRFDASSSSQYAQNLYDVLRKHHPETDPWFLNTFGGYYHVKHAWELRGGGYAREVTDDGWKGFREHLAAARDCLTAAWKLEPGLPEAPAKMIPVAMGAGNDLKEDARTWFDRACQAQFDYSEAYRSYLFNLAPRWHGSPMDQIALGQECFQTGRFDTRVPSILLTAMESVASDADLTLPAFLREAEVFPMFREFYDAELKSPQRRVPEDYLRWRFVAVAFGAGEFEAASKVLGEINSPPNLYYFNAYGVLFREVQDMSNVMGSPLQDDILLAEGMRQRGRITPALELLKPMLEKLDAGAPARAFVAGRVASLQALRDFAAGNVVHLQPADASMPGWLPINGDWKLRDDGAIEGISSATGCQFVFAADFGTRLELTGTVEIDGTTLNDQGGAIVCFKDTFRQQQLRVIPSAKRARVSDGNNGGYNYDDVPMRQHNEFAIQVWEGQYWATVNGKLVLQDTKLFSLTDPQGYVGLVGTNLAVGRTVRFRDLKIRKLVVPPEASEK